MEPIEIAAQCIGILAMLFNILSYQGKNQKSIIALQLIGASLFSLNFLMLGAVVGGILNILAAIRAVVFLFKNQLKADRLPWFILFCACYVTVYILNFTLFHKELTPYRLLVELLPVIGMVALNIGYRLTNAAAVRRCGLVSSPAWLIYNITVGSWGAIVCEVLTLISIFVGIFRHDIRTKR
jgi:hypothetical protein